MTRPIDISLGHQGGGVRFEVQSTTRAIIVRVDENGKASISVRPFKAGTGQPFEFTLPADAEPEPAATADDPERIPHYELGIMDTYRVRSETDPGKNYIVKHWANGSWSCSCPQWTNRRPDGGCKHIQRKREESLTKILDASRRGVRTGG